MPAHCLRLRAVLYLMSRLSCLYVVYGRYGTVIPARGGRSSRQKLALWCLCVVLLGSVP